jgi:hypothetical protein
MLKIEAYFALSSNGCVQRVFSKLLFTSGNFSRAGLLEETAKTSS